MARRCELTGKGVLSGNNVSHANNKTRRRFLPNLVNVTLISDTLSQRVRFRLAASTLRSIDHQGGLDSFLIGADPDKLSLKARRLRKLIRDKRADAAATAAPAA